MTQAEYLEAEFRRYYPDAHTLVVTEVDESIYVDICMPNAVLLLSWVFACGSDDDYYTFTRVGMDPLFPDTRQVLTIPLMPA